jgi:hypothetical protein
MWGRTCGVECNGEVPKWHSRVFTAPAMTANNEDGSPPLAGPSHPPSTNAPPPSSSPGHEHPSSSSSTPTPTPTPTRSELLDRARHFLSSPQVMHQDYESKRRFLAEKGLSNDEVQLLLREMVRTLVSLPIKLEPQPVLSGLILPPSETAFAIAPRANSDVSRASPVSSAGPPRRHIQSAFMASGRLHRPTLHLLRA